MQRFSTLVATLLACGCWIGLFVEPGTAAEQRSISVSGTGRVSTTPDTAEFDVGVVTQASTAQEALEKNSQAMNELFSEARNLGIPEKHLQTTRFDVQPVHSQPSPQRSRQEEPKIVGYRVTNTLHVRLVKKTDMLGTALDAFIQAGSNNVSGIRFSVAESVELTDQARREAVQDARRKAELYAEACDVTLGKVLTVREQSAPGPRPLSMGRTMAMEQASSVPVATGEQEIEVTVYIDFALNGPDA